jgi:hypothetical protein
MVFASPKYFGLTLKMFAAGLVAPLEMFQFGSAIRMNTNGLNQTLNENQTLNVSQLQQILKEEEDHHVDQHLNHNLNDSKNIVHEDLLWDDHSNNSADSEQKKGLLWDDHSNNSADSEQKKEGELHQLLTVDSNEELKEGGLQEDGEEVEEDSELQEEERIKLLQHCREMQRQQKEIQRKQHADLRQDTLS